MRFVLILSLLAAFSAHAEEERISTPYKKPAKKAAPKKAEEAAAAEPEKNEDSTWDKVKEKTAEGAEAVAEGAKKAQSSLAAARERRGERDWTITGNYQFFELWVMTKYGFTIGYNRSPSSTYEFELMHGSLGLGKMGIDLVEITETRMSLIWRSYNQRDSFNFIYGLYYNEIEAGYGSAWLASVPGGGHVDAVNIQTLGFTWGLGNRWITKSGFVWGADWFNINVPLVVLKSENAFVDATTDPEDREDAKDAQNFFERFPEFGALKFQLGFSW